MKDCFGLDILRCLGFWLLAIAGIIILVAFKKPIVIIIAGIVWIVGLFYLCKSETLSFVSNIILTSQTRQFIGGLRAQRPVVTFNMECWHEHHDKNGTHKVVTHRAAQVF
jgi:hypothetical protein